MTLREKQSLFISRLAKLIVWINRQGWDLTLGDGLRRDEKGHMPGSLHYIGLAQDLNLFIEGKWIRDGAHPAWKSIGLKWEELGGTWGGRFGDSNHFSQAHDGKK